MRGTPTGAFRKASLLRSLPLDPAILQHMASALDEDAEEETRSAWQVLIGLSSRMISPHTAISNMQMAKDLASLPSEVVLHFAETATEKAASEQASSAIESFKQYLHIAPVGRLHLERLEMMPVGVERGELVFTVPMTPLESATISHKEWSTSSREYEDLVSDSFESFSERGVAEKTDASMSTENEARHTSELTFGASLSGSYTGVSLTTTFGLKNTRDERESARRSLQRNSEITQKASARAKTEHKVSVKLEAKQGTSDSTFRTITNPSATNAIRVDYYRMMRKWRTSLYRYGLRVTYDMTIPNPGARLFARYQLLSRLEEKLRTPFSFGLHPEDLTDSNWAAEALAHGAGVTSPPAPILTALPTQDIAFIGADEAFETRLGKLEVEVPEGYKVKSAAFTAHAIPYPAANVRFELLDDGSIGGALPNTGPLTITSASPQLIGRTGRISTAYLYREISAATMRLDLVFERLPSALAAWQLAAWSTIRAAAERRYQDELSQVQRRRDALWLELSNKDTLSLRRLEREELLRLIMEWMLGPQAFDTAPPMVASTIEKVVKNEGLLLEGGAGPMLPIDSKDRDEVLAFGDFVKFIHQAVEWENLLYFMYPYFWGSESLGQQKILFEHADPEHRNFLRAGYARVVITIRPGFEADFTQLLETGTLSAEKTSPYVSVAEEIANFARTNYANMAPANPEKHARPLLYPQQRATWDTMQVAVAQIDSYHDDNKSYPPALDVLPGAPFKDAWGRPLVYRVPGSGNDFDLLSLGANGVEGGDDLNADISAAAVASLVGSWFEYTPTSGMDIEIDTNGSDIA